MPDRGWAGSGLGLPADRVRGSALSSPEPQPEPRPIDVRPHPGRSRARREERPDRRQSARVLHLGGADPGVCPVRRAGTALRRKRVLAGTGFRRPRFRLALHHRRRGISGLRHLSDAQPPRRHKAGPLRERARLQLYQLVRDAVQCRHGHRPRLLRRGRTDPALRLAPDRRRADGGRGAAGNDADLLSLGPACVGDLYRGRPVASLFLVPARPAADHPLGAVPPDRTADQRADRPCGRHIRGAGHHVRRGDLAWLWRAAGECRLCLSVRRTRRHGHPADPDRRRHRAGDAVGVPRPRQGGEAPFRTQHCPGHRAAGLRAVFRLHNLPASGLRAERGHLSGRGRAPYLPHVCL